ncbi:hypothetical protein EST92_29985 [Streptomyces sp. TM32]|uniref:hypothetical protein n=1 Tax=Streptomyces sp. TM32 TaxID=1652669 RepID=UPI0010114C0C|nr:hypothetical protein [Streptomyces sp. TM32]RXS65267.1 hypothetical protein EST92_29985 [Streptomyces sp. TM32]
MHVATAYVENPLVKAVLIVVLLLVLLTTLFIAGAGPRTSPKEKARRREALEEKWEAELRQEEEEREARARREEEEREARARREEARVEQEIARAKREEEQRRAHTRERQLRAREERRHADALWADPKLREDILDHYLRWLLSRPSEESDSDRSTLVWFRGQKLNQAVIERARTWASSEGYAVHDGRRWRLTRRGQRIFEEYGGDRKRMSNVEKKRQQPSVKIDARGAGTVAHTISGGVQKSTVNNTVPGAQTSGEVDLAAALQLVEQLRRALPDANGLSRLDRERAEDDLGNVDRELRASAEDRNPGRIQSALEGLRTTFVSVDGLVQVVNQLWGHVHVWFSS